MFIEEKRKGISAKRGLPLRERSLSDLESRLGMFARIHGAELVKRLREDTVRAWLFADPDLAPQTRVNYFRNSATFSTTP
jgi:hypothetical protein